MKKEVVKKIEEEIKQKTTLPENIKEKIKKEIFINILIAIGLVIYFTFLILGSVGTIKSVRSIDFNIFSMIILGIAIYLFEISYKKDNGKLAIFGVEALMTAIFTLFLPYIIFELEKTHKVYYLIIGGYIGLYYIIKCVCISLKTKKEYITELSDIKDIIKKEKRKASIKENRQTIEIISDSEINKHEKDKKEQDNNTAKTVKNKTKDTTKKAKNNQEKDIAKKELASKKKTSKIEENTVTNNAPKKRGRPKKSETKNNENKNNVGFEPQGDPKPKKRGRPKKEESLKKEIDKKFEDEPKKRGRPRKVVTSND